MSFILDALRKSEHERQRQTGPALVETPVAVPKPKSNTWAVAAIALLVVNLVAIGGLLLWKSRDDSTTAAAATAASAAPVASAVTPAASTPPPSPAAQANITQSAPAPVAPPPMLRPAAESPARVSGGNPLEREMASTVPGMEAEAAAAAAAPPPGPAAVQATRRGSVVYQELPEAGPVTGNRSAPAAAAGSSTSNLPTADELMGRGLPEMRLELHFYASRPQERFVFINGGRYREGDTTPEGVTIVEIVPEGVIMNQGGNRFLLPRP